MNEIIILAMIMGAYTICGIWAMIDEKIDRVKRERRRQRKEFVKAHPNYGLDYEGNLVKIK